MKKTWRVDEFTFIHRHFPTTPNNAFGKLARVGAVLGLGVRHRSDRPQ